MGDDGAGAWGAGCGEDGFFGEVDFVDFGGEELFGVVVAVGPDGIPSGGGVGIGVHLAGWVKARLGSVYRFSSRRVFGDVGSSTGQGTRNRPLAGVLASDPRNIPVQVLSRRLRPAAWGPVVAGAVDRRVKIGIFFYMCCYFAAQFLTFVPSGAWWRGQRGVVTMRARVPSASVAAKMRRWPPWSMRRRAARAGTVRGKLRAVRLALG